MSPNTLAIGLFLLAFGFILTLSAFCLGMTLFKDEANTPEIINSHRERFWLDRLIGSQKPQTQRFSYGLYAASVLMMLAGSSWLLAQPL